MRKLLLTLVAMLAVGGAFANALTEAALSSVRFEATPAAKGAAKGGRMMLMAAPTSGGCDVVLAFTGEEDVQVTTDDFKVTRDTDLDFDFTGDDEMVPLYYTVSSLADPSQSERYEIPADGHYVVRVLTNVRVEVVCRRPIYVDADSAHRGKGPSASAGYYPTNALETIQEAVDLALDGAEVRVAGGCTYAPFAVTNRELRIVSDLGNPAIVDGAGAGRCVEIAQTCSNEVENAFMTVPATNGLMTVTGFTLTNGCATAGAAAWGGTFVCCRVLGCTATGGGNVLYGVEARNCLIADCTAPEGNVATGSVLKNCTVVSNKSSVAVAPATGLPSAVCNSIVFENDGDPVSDEVTSIATFTEGVLFGEGYHLRENSPGVGGALQGYVEDEVDLEGRPRRDGVNVTAGCFQSVTAHTGLVGVEVDGVDLSHAAGTGWTYDSTTKVLTITSGGFYLLSGAATGVTVRVAANASFRLADLELGETALSVANGKMLTIAGGTANLGCTANVSGNVVIAGGSVNLNGKTFASATDVFGKRIRRCVEVGGLSGSVGLRGIEGYETRGLRADADGKIYLWLADGTGTFTVADDDHPAGAKVVYAAGDNLSRAEVCESVPTGDIGLVVGGTDVRVLTGTDWIYYPVSKELVLFADVDYALSGSSKGPRVSVVANAGVRFDNLRLEAEGAAISVSDGKTLTIRGGTADLRGTTGVTGSVVIAGGSILPNGDVFADTPTDEAGQAVYRVEVGLGSQGSGIGDQVRIDGLDGYDTDGIFAVGGKVYLYLPNGEYVFSANGEYYRAAVVDGPATAIPGVLPAVDYVDCDGSATAKDTTWAYELTAAMREIGNGDWFVVTGAVTTANLAVNGKAFLILADDATLTVTGDLTGGELVVYGQANSSGKLVVEGTASASLTVKGCQVDAPFASSVTVAGGTVSTVKEGASLTVDGGSVLAEQGVTATNSAGDAVYCVTVEGLEGLEGLVGFEGLERYGVHGVYLIDGKAYLWLPNGKHIFWVGDSTYVATVNGKPKTVQKTDLLRVEYIDGDGATKVAAAREITAATTDIGDDNWYVVTGDVATVGLVVQDTGNWNYEGTANLILCDGSTLTATGGWRKAGIEVRQNATLSIYGQARGTGRLDAISVDEGGGAGIGGGFEHNGGVISIYGGIVTAKGSNWSTVYHGAGIGGGYHGDGGAVTVYAGTVVATAGGGGDDFGGGHGRDGGTLTILGGSVLATHDTVAEGQRPNSVYGYAVPSNASERVYRVTVDMAGANGGEPVTVRGLPSDYGTTGLTPVDGKLYLWLPNGNYSFWADGIPYAATVADASTKAVDMRPSEVDYLAWNGSALVPRKAMAYELTSSLTEIGDDNWYVVKKDLTMTGLTVNGKAHLILADGKTLTANGGVRVTEGNALSIYAQSEGDGMGALVANASANYEAGIGGSNGKGAGTIVIHGGKVTANGRYGAAGVGGGYYGGDGGAIAIHGGQVTATAGFGAAGIGGGNGKPGRTITITGGEVTATGGESGAGIGGGYHCTGGKITISGGVVTAKAGSGNNNGGAGIGGGSAWGNVGCSGGTITITGGEVVATGYKCGAGIGGGYDGAGGTITISGGRVTATGGTNAAGIGGGKRNNLNEQGGGAGGRVTITGGTVVASGNGDAADIGPGGHSGWNGTVTITGGSVLATRSDIRPSPKDGANRVVYCVTVEGLEGLESLEGLAGYGLNDMTLIGDKLYLYLPNGTYEFKVNGVTYMAAVSGAATTATVKQVVEYLDWDGSKLVPKAAANAQPLTSDTTEIGGDNWYVVTGKVTTSNLKVNGTAHLILADGSLLDARASGTRAGVEVSGSDTLNIYGQTGGTGTLNATGKDHGAGIGGNIYNSCGTVTINGGRVTARGGNVGGAGIGGGASGTVTAKSGSGGTVTINGGTVTAECCDGYGAGIGGADGGAFCSGGDGGIVIIRGGTVDAKGGPDGGVGIGGGGCSRTSYSTYRLSGGTGADVNISGGTVRATGVGDAVDIGGGKNSSSDGTLTITGGNVCRAHGTGATPSGGVSLRTITIPSNVDASKLVNLLSLTTSYGFNDVYPIDRNLYLYLPTGTQSIAFAHNGVEYEATDLSDGAKVTARERTKLESVSYIDPTASEGQQAKAVDAYVVGSDRTVLADGYWYVVAGAVTTVNLAVNGTANLILSDDATLTVTGDLTGGELVVYGQANSSGKLVTHGTVSASMTIKGGQVDTQISSSVSVAGGTVSTVKEGASLTVDGGSVLADEGVTAKNSSGDAVYCVTVDVREQGTGNGERVAIEGLGDYGTCGIRPIDGKLHLWLPNGAYWLTIGGEKFSAQVQDSDTVACHVLTPVNYKVADGAVLLATDVGVIESVGSLTVGGGNWYVVTSDVALSALSVSGTANLILADGAELQVTGGVTGGTLNVYSQTAGTGKLTVSGALDADLTLNGGTVTAGTVKGGLLTVGGGTLLTASTVEAEQTVITGGNVMADGFANTPRNAAGTKVYCVQLSGYPQNYRADVKDSERILVSYGTEDLFPVGNGATGVICLYLPNGTYSVGARPVVAGRGALLEARVTVASAAVSGEFSDTAGLRVNGFLLEILMEGVGEPFGLAYDETSRVLTVTTNECLVTGKPEIDPVGIRMAVDATLVLSNATLDATYGAAALTIDADRTVTVLTTGGNSVLTGKDFMPAISCGGDATLNVDAHETATDDTALNLYGAENAPAISGGAVTVRGGNTRIAGWEGLPQQPAVKGGTFAVVSPVVMKAGDSTADMRMVETYGGEAIVSAAEMYPVSVPRTEGVVCTAIDSELNSVADEGDEANRVYWIRRGFDVTFNFAPAGDDWLLEFETNVTVHVEGASAVPAAAVPRAWQAASVSYVDENGAAAGPVRAIIVKDTTDALLDGKWHVVLGEVTTTNLRVDGTANLILADGAKLTATGYGEPGIEVTGEGIAEKGNDSLTIYGQAGGTGTIVANGGTNCAGIGCASGNNKSSGSITINGGIVKATGNVLGAGIGGSNSLNWLYYGNCSTVTINGGTVTATGGESGAGIGGGTFGVGGSVTINGGTVTATGGDGVADIGSVASTLGDGSLTITGGNVYRAHGTGATPSNAVPERVYCVTVEVREQGIGNGEQVWIDDLGDYGTSGIRPIDGKVYLWLPNGDGYFTVKDADGVLQGYRYSVKDGPATAQPYGPNDAALYVNGLNVLYGPRTGWNFNAGTQTLTLDGTIDGYMINGSNAAVRVVAKGSDVFLDAATVGTLEIGEQAFVQLGFSGAGCEIAQGIALGDGSTLRLCSGTARIGQISGSEKNRLEILGGSIELGADLPADLQPHGNLEDAVVLKTVVCVPEDTPEDQPVQIVGLGAYETRELYPRDGRLYLYLQDLPNAKSRVCFTVNGHYYYLPAGRPDGFEIVEVKTGFAVDGRDCGEGSGDGWSYDICSRTLMLSDATKTYELFCTNDVMEWAVTPTASAGQSATICGTLGRTAGGCRFVGTFLLAGGNFIVEESAFSVAPTDVTGQAVHPVILTLPDDVDPALPIEVSGPAVDGYSTDGMYAVDREVWLWLADGTNLEFAVNGARCRAKVDGGPAEAEYCETGVFVDGDDCATLKGAGWSWSPVTKRLTLDGAHVLDSEAAADLPDKVILVGGKGAEICGGTSELPAEDVAGGLLITGGSHRFEGTFAVPPSNGVARVWRVEAKVPYGVADGDEVSVDCAGYDGTGIRVRDGRVWLWLPDTPSLYFTIDGTLYHVTVDGANATASVHTTGLCVNGADIGGGRGFGWTWDSSTGRLALSGTADSYTYSSAAPANDDDVNLALTEITNSMTLALHGVRILTGGGSAAFTAAKNAEVTLRFKGPRNAILGERFGDDAVSGLALAGAGEYVIAGGTAEIGRSDGGPSVASRLTINGGSIRIGSEADFAQPPVNAASQRVYRVTVPMPRLADRGRALEVEGLPDDYDVSEIYPYEGDVAEEVGNIYLWLPTNSYHFAVGGYGFSTVVQGDGWTEAEPDVRPTGVTVNGVDCSYGSDVGWTWSSDDGILSLSGACEYVLAGANTEGRVGVAVTNAEKETRVLLDDVILSGFGNQGSAIDIAPGAHLVLGLIGDDDNVGPMLTGATGSYNAGDENGAGGAGIHVPEGAKLTIGGTFSVETDSYSMLTASGGRLAAGIGGVAGEAMGEVTICDHVVAADGGDRAAGIGGGSRGAGGSLLVTGGEIFAFGGSGIDSSHQRDDLGGAGIGGGYGGAGGAVKIEGGVVAALGGAGGAVIGGGAGGDGGVLEICGGTVYPYASASGVDGASVFGGGSGGADGANVFRGGSIAVTNGVIRAAPTDGEKPVSLVQVELPRDIENNPDYVSHFVRVRIDGLGDYGMEDVFTYEGKVYLWLPDGDYAFTMQDIAYSVSVTNGVVTERHYRATGVTVNGRDVCFSEGPGWSWSPVTGALSLTDAADYVVSGEAELSNVWVNASGAARVVLSNFTAAADIALPLQAAAGQPSFRFTGAPDRFAAIGGEGTAVIAGGNVVLGSIPEGAKVVVSGGNVFVEGEFPTNEVKDAAGRPVVPVTITLPDGCVADTPVSFVGLPADYDTTDIRAIGGKVCVWLPYGTYEIDATGCDPDGASLSWSCEVTVYDFGYTTRSLEQIVVQDDDGRDVVISRSWVRRYGLVGENASTADYANAVLQPSANDGIPVWQSFVAGLDPTNPNETFRAAIEMLDGDRVSVGPNAARTGRVYKVIASKDLEFAETATFAVGANGFVILDTATGYRFFKVTVGLE